MTHSRPRRNQQRLGRRSPAAKAKILNEWRKSGLPAAAFAASKGIGRNSLFVWRRSLAADEAAGGRRRFRPVRLPPQPKAGVGVTVRGPGGLSVVVEAGADEDVLVIALRALRRCG
jgi:transposase-like protein